MSARKVMAALLLTGAIETAAAQTATKPDEPNVPGRAPSNPSDTYRSKIDLNANVANPYAAPTAPRRKAGSGYQYEPNPDASAASATGKKLIVNPGETSAARQSGVTTGDARSLMQQQGYTGVSGLRAEPGSIWVWQADATKNGRRVRLGIDYRGNLLELGGAQPCTAPPPGQGLGLNSPIGTGIRLSEATGCKNQ